MTQQHLLAIQEDDWGSLKIFNIDPTSGQMEVSRNIRYSEAHSDDAKYLLGSNSILCSVDSNGTAAFYNFDGEEIFSSSSLSQAGGRNLSAPFFNIKNDNVNGDQFIGYSTDGKNSGNIVRRTVINPLQANEVHTDLFDISLFSEYNNANWNARYLFETNAGLFAVIYNSTDKKTRLYKMTAQDIWTVQSTVSIGQPQFDYDGYVLSNSETQLEVL
ncbi:MAG: hypothetical protein ABW007_02990, partial [Chitinophagaceae bacterium]